MSLTNTGKADINSFMPNFIISLPIFFFCLVIHEFAHGFMAEKCGDSTARYLGRLTLNPMAHIDPFGTVMLPLLLYFMHSPVMFGWAKPVPINPLNFRNPRWDSLKVSLAGPGANILTAVSAGLILHGFSLAHLNPGIAGGILKFMILISLVLAIFNLVPVPPLDGSHILAALLPSHLAYKYESFQRYGFILIVILLYLGFFDNVVFPLAYLMTSLLIPGSMFFL